MALPRPGVDLLVQDAPHADGLWDGGLVQRVGQESRTGAASRARVAASPLRSEEQSSGSRAVSFPALFRSLLAGDIAGVVAGWAPSTRSLSGPSTSPTVATGEQGPSVDGLEFGERAPTLGVSAQERGGDTSLLVAGSTAQVWTRKRPVRRACFLDAQSYSNTLIQ